MGEGGEFELKALMVGSAPSAKCVYVCLCGHMLVCVFLSFFEDVFS